MPDMVARLNAALQGRYRVEQALGEGGTVRGPRHLIRTPALLGLLIVEALPACGDAPTASADPAVYSYRVPPDLGDGLGNADARSLGMTVSLLERMVRQIGDGTWPNIHAVLVFVNEDLVLEKYFPGVMRADSTYRTFDRFDPLGIEQYRLLHYPSGVANSGGGLFLRPRDMLKLGVLYLEGGTWQDRRIVPESWVTEATHSQGPSPIYGYQWWVGTGNFDGRSLRWFRALGLAGQHVFVFPGVELVVVFTSNGSESAPYALVEDFILPSSVNQLSPGGTRRARCLPLRGAPRMLTTV